MPVRAKDATVAHEDAKFHILSREFASRGDHGYSMVFEPYHVQFELDRLRRMREGLIGELIVRVNGGFPKARTVEGMLQVGDLNLSSVQARSSRAKLLEQRSGEAGWDWYGSLEEFVIRVTEAERRGQPPTDLGAVALDEGSEPEGGDSWDLDPIRIWREHPSILFADGGSGKSYVALYLAGQIAQTLGPVVYADWEYSERAHRKRLWKLFQPAPKGIYYTRCDRPMRDEAERLARIISEKQAVYLICDSVGYACNHRPEDAENANEYFRALRQCRVGSLNLHHVSRPDGTDQKVDKPFGSAYWHNGARGVWHLQRAQENPKGQMNFALFNRKWQDGDPSEVQPRARRMLFRGDRVLMEHAELTETEELTAGLPSLERIKRYLTTNGPRQPKDIAEDLGLPASSVRVTLTRHANSFVKVGKNYGVKTERELAF